MCDEIYTLGNVLREVRTEKKLTIQQVADRLGIHRTTYANYESDASMPSISTLKKIAKLYNVSMDRLCGLKPSNHPILELPNNLTSKQMDILRSLLDEFSGRDIK